MSLNKGSDFWIRRLPKHKPLILLAVPLALSAYTHLWNPAGFPFWHIDEGVYVERALRSLDLDILYSKHDHPFLGWTVLAGFLHVAGYPGLLATSADPSSLGMLYGIPRVLMGMLAVLDTFLIYKIAEKRFGRRAAPVAATLFAVMPVSLTLRMVLLDSILLPFVLASVLLAMHAHGAGQKGGPPGPDPGSRGGETGAAGSLHGGAVRPVPGAPNPVLDRARLLMVLSGACMGCAILVKIPSVAMIPLVLALAYSANRSPRQALLWLAPVILIPLVWPASAALAGEFDLWTDGVLWQADRNIQHRLDMLQQYLPVDLAQGQDSDVLIRPLILLMAMGGLFLRDPVLMALGTAGLAFAVATRNRFLILWAAPVLLFFGSIGHVAYFHLGMLWVAMCVAAAALISYGIGRMHAGGGRSARDLALLAAVAAIAALGLSTSGVFVHWDVTSPYLDALSLVLQNRADIDAVAIMWHENLRFLHVRDLDHSAAFSPRWSDFAPAMTDRIILLASPSGIDYHLRLLGADHGGNAATAAELRTADRRQIFVDMHDGGSTLATFRGALMPDSPAFPNNLFMYAGDNRMNVIEYALERTLLQTYSPGGRSLDLDSSASIALADTLDLCFGTDPFSITFWIKKPSPGGSDTPIMSKPGTAHEPGISVAMPGYMDGRISVQVGHVASNHIRTDSFYSVADGHWHHVVLTYDGSGGLEGLNLYVDGRNNNIRWAETRLTGSAANDRPLTIGAGNTGAGTAQGALLDDVMIYSEKLPEEYVSEVHECHAERAVVLAAAGGARSGSVPAGGRACAGGGYGDALLAHLEFEGDLSDSSGNGNGGTARGDVRYG